MRDKFSLLLALSKKNAELGQVVENIDEYSDEQLQSMVFQPFWIPETLVHLKRKIKLDKIIEEQASNIYLAKDVFGKIYEYNGQDKFIKLGKGLSSISDKDLIFIEDDSQIVWLSWMHADYKDFDSTIDLKFIENAPRTEYNLMVRKHINEKYGNVSSNNNEEVKPMFKIKEWK